MEWVHSRIGGSVTTSRRKRTWHRQAYQVVVVGRTAGRILRELQPHLIIKNAQAQLALTYLGELTSFRGHLVPQEVLARREELYLRALSLNGGARRGRPKKS